MNSHSFIFSLLSSKVSNLLISIFAITIHFFLHYLLRLLYSAENVPALSSLLLTPPQIFPPTSSPLLYARLIFLSSRPHLFPLPISTYAVTTLLLLTPPHFLVSTYAFTTYSTSFSWFHLCIYYLYPPVHLLHSTYLPHLISLFPPIYYPPPTYSTYDFSTYFISTSYILHFNTQTF